MGKKVTIAAKPRKRSLTADDWVAGTGTTEVVEKPAEEKIRLSKVTWYVRPDQITAVEDIQLAERKRTGRKPDKSDLIQEALDLLIKKYNR
jgi:hypothetical protein